MADGLRVDMTTLNRALRNLPKAANRGSAIAMGDIKRDWVREARDIAPLDTSNLRRQIQSEQFSPEKNGYIEIRANAKNGGFNYGYYIHEMNAGGKNLRTSGTEKKFLDVSAESREDDWKRWLEEEIEKELRREGW